MPEYRDICGFPGYRVSECGAVQSSWRRGGVPVITGVWRDLSPSTTSKYGHQSVVLVSGGKKKSWGVHVLVAMAFKGACPDGMECRHLDGNPRNNHRDNLEWGTPLENAADRNRHGRTARGNAHRNAKLTDGDVAEVRRRVAAGESRKSVAAWFNVTRQCVYQLVRSKRRVPGLTLTGTA